MWFSHDNNLWLCFGPLALETTSCHGLGLSPLWSPTAPENSAAMRNTTKMNKWHTSTSATSGSCSALMIILWDRWRGRYRCSLLLVMVGIFRVWLKVTCTAGFSTKLSNTVIMSILEGLPGNSKAERLQNDFAHIISYIIYHITSHIISKVLNIVKNYDFQILP